MTVRRTSGAERDPDLEGHGVFFTARRVWQEIGRDRVFSVAGGLTFFALLAVFPAITVLVSVFGLFADPAQAGDYVAGMTSLLPQEAAGVLVDQARSIASARSAHLSLTAIVALVLALWSANGGTKALIEALNVAYGVTERRGFLRLNALSLVWTALGVVFGVALIWAVAVLPALLDYVGLGPAAETLLLVGRWPAIFALLMLGLAVAYRFGPNLREPRWQWISPGALLAAVGLVIFSLLFSWYVRNFGSYNETYGTLGAVVVLLTWMWISAALILTGAELNSELDRQSLGAGGVSKQNLGR